MYGRDLSRPIPVVLFDIWGRVMGLARGNLRKSGRCVSRPWSQSASATRRLNIKDLRKIRGPNLRRSAIKKCASRDNFLGRMRGGIGRDRSRPYMAAGIGSLVFLLVADLRRWRTRIGRGSFYFCVALFTRIGTSACFAAAGSTRIDSANPTCGWYRSRGLSIRANPGTGQQTRRRMRFIKTKS